MENSKCLILRAFVIVYKAIIKKNFAHLFCDDCMIHAVL